MSIFPRKLCKETKWTKNNETKSDWRKETKLSLRPTWWHACIRCHFHICQLLKRTSHSSVSPHFANSLICSSLGFCFSNSIHHTYMAGMRLLPEDSDVTQLRPPAAADLISDDDRSVAADSWSIKSEYGSTLDDEQRHADATEALNYRAEYRFLYIETITLPVMLKMLLV